MSKLVEKEKAVKLRKRGFSYNDILKEIPVAKSTLSLWLRSIGLAKKHKQKLTEKRRIAALRGARARREQRLAITREIRDKAKRDIDKLSKKELWFLGIALYWGEGHKERSKSSLVRLGNSDPKMIIVFLKWLYEICGIEKKDIVFRIYLHETSKHRLGDVIKHWAKVTKFPQESFQQITWKKNKVNTNRKNIGKDYYGLLDVGVKRSINLNRRIQGWIEGIYEHCGVVQW